ncbi:hypothetical protein [Gemmata sp. SH-PL17]|uniref:hypothetical protein n=1 Tax=Gemmata sp. SH-PL17 TaxID=1630693 RepID=UPI0012FA2469|nr:hypothetical protein [Gemmata sp. SH-PL17]
MILERPSPRATYRTRRAHLALVHQQMGAGGAARTERDSLARDIGRSYPVVWGELPDRVRARRSVHKSEPPVLWPEP